MQQSLVHVILQSVGTDSCVNTIEFTISQFTECCTTFIGSYTVSFEGHEVQACFCLGSVSKYGTIASNLFGITDVDHCGESGASSTNSLIELPATEVGECTVQTATVCYEQGEPRSAEESDEIECGEGGHGYIGAKQVLHGQFLTGNLS